MKIVILDRSAMGDDLDFSLLEKYGEVFSYDATTAQNLCERICDADAVFVNKIRLDGDSLRCAKKLRLICEFATGYDNIDVNFCRDNGIAVCNVRGYSTDSVVQITVATVLMLLNRMKEYCGYVVSGEYSKSGAANKISPAFHELRGRTWGVVGYGNIGSAVASVARAFGCRVLVYRRGKDGNGVVDIDTLCRESDIITLHVPLNEETKCLISRERFSLMKKDVIIVNEARGGVWDESAAADAVASGSVGGLGCDVYTGEPMTSDNPLSTVSGFPNVVLTPHMAWAAYESRVRCLEECVKNIDAFLSGETRNRVDV